MRSGLRWLHASTRGGIPRQPLHHRHNHATTARIYSRIPGLNNSRRTPLASSESSLGSPASDRSLRHFSNTTTHPDGKDAPPTAYEECVRRLYQTNLYNPVKLGLENMQKLHALMGNPMDQPEVAVIHIAGTNGKGSVALKIAKTLELTGNLNVGLFCSPHVSSFRERMQLNSQLISEQQVVEYLPQLYQLCQEHDIPATFFELTTALAFQFYHANNAHVVVLETGLGGRLDSTNVVQAPVCSIITSIGLEHTRILGDTVEKIALEKGGIIKPNRPVLVGPNVPMDVLRQCAQDKRASGFYTCEDLLDDQHDNHIETGTIVDYDVENARIARAAIQLLQLEQERSEHKILPMLGPIPEAVIQRGTSQRPPCRFEQVQLEDGLSVILDVAHNPPAMEYLVHKLRSTYPVAKFRMIVGMSSDKDASQCGASVLKAVNGNAGALHLVQAAHPRAAKLEDMLAADASGLFQTQSHYDMEDRSVTRQIQIGIELARQEEEILVVCGSVFLMAEAREALGFDEPRDSEYIAEVAGSHLKHSQENFGENSKVATGSDANKK